MWLHGCSITLMLVGINIITYLLSMTVLGARESKVYRPRGLVNFPDQSLQSIRPRLLGLRNGIPYRPGASPPWLQPSFDIAVEITPFFLSLYYNHLRAKNPHIMDTCVRCGGRGTDPLEGTCSRCQGSGEV